MGDVIEVDEDGGFDIPTTTVVGLPSPSARCSSKTATAAPVSWGIWTRSIFAKKRILA